MMASPVTLNWYERLFAATVGVHRQAHAEANGHRIVSLGSASPEDAHIKGARGEIAFAKWMGVYWPMDLGLNKDRGDVGGWHVRCAGTHEQLIIREDDAPDGKFVLLTGREGAYHVRGWFLARDARALGKRHEWWRNPVKGMAPAWWIPVDALHDIHRGVDAAEIVFRNAETWDGGA